MNVHITAAAERDLEEIADDIARDSPVRVLSELPGQRGGVGEAIDGAWISRRR